MPGSRTELERLDVLVVEVCDLLVPVSDSLLPVIGRGSHTLLVDVQILTNSKPEELSLNKYKKIIFVTTNTTSHLRVTTNTKSKIDKSYNQSQMRLKTPLTFLFSCTLYSHVETCTGLHASGLSWIVHHPSTGVTNKIRMLQEYFKQNFFIYLELLRF